MVIAVTKPVQKEKLLLVSVTIFSRCLKYVVLLLLNMFAVFIFVEMILTFAFVGVNYCSKWVEHFT